MMDVDQQGGRWRARALHTHTFRKVVTLDCVHYKDEGDQNCDIHDQVLLLVCYIYEGPLVMFTSLELKVNTDIICVAV